MKNVVKRGVDLYINGSIHVSFATFSLVQVTFYFLKIPFDLVTSLLVFFGTLFSYNFIKYAELIYQRKIAFSNDVKKVIILSFSALLIAIGCFFLLKIKAQIATIFFLFLSVLYAIPINSHVSNLRNWAGIKIYIVSFCWAGVTLILPVLNAGLPFSLDIAIIFIQRFILVLILILIFEIVDLQFDDKRLKTVPQAIGIAKTKQLICILLLPFYFLELFKDEFLPFQVFNNLILLFLVLYFTFKASPKQTKYFTLFWVESVPIVWWLLIVLESYFSRV